MRKHTRLAAGFVGLVAAAALAATIIDGAPPKPAPRFGSLAATGAGQFRDYSYSWRIHNSAAVFAFAPAIGHAASPDQTLVVAAARHAIEQEFGLQNAGAPSRDGVFLRFPTSSGDFVVMPIAEADGMIHGLGFSRPPAESRMDRR